MPKYYIDLSNYKCAKDFCAVAANKSGYVTLKSGRYIVDGKSILGIFSLDLSFPIELEVEDGNYEDFYRFQINSEV